MITLVTFAIVLLSLGHANAQDACITPLSTNGICINIKSCESLVNILKRPRPLAQHLLDFLRDSHCGFDDSIPKVCCPNQGTEVVPPVTVPTEPKQTENLDPPDVSNHPSIRLLNHDICGPITEGRIFGGNKTGVFDFPWMALLAYDVGKPSPEFRCGGTLINKRYVLTAAHCVIFLPSDLTLVGVRLGDHDVTTERDCDKDEDGLEIACAEKYQDFQIEALHYHPEYSKSVYTNDIALLRLNKDVNLKPRNVRPICLPLGPPVALPPKVTVTGWGATEFGPRSNDLLQVSLSPVSYEECKEIYKNNIKIWHKQLCAGGKKRMDSCFGDSGGPLQAFGQYNNNYRYIQYGVVSFGLKYCGTEGSPGVYTNVRYYMDWILDTMRD